jgi:hypothetical protein
MSGKGNKRQRTMSSSQDGPSRAEKKKKKENKDKKSDLQGTNRARNTSTLSVNTVSLVATPTLHPASWLQGVATPNAAAQSHQANFINPGNYKGRL